jgi:hypothetical protein
VRGSGFFERAVLRGNSLSKLQLSENAFAVFGVDWPKRLALAWVLKSEISRRGSAGRKLISYPARTPACRWRTGHVASVDNRHPDGKCNTAATFTDYGLLS